MRKKAKPLRALETKKIGLRLRHTGTINLAYTLQNFLMLTKGDLCTKDSLQEMQRRPWWWRVLKSYLDMQNMSVSLKKKQTNTLKGILRSVTRSTTITRKLRGKIKGISKYIKMNLKQMSVRNLRKQKVWRKFSLISMKILKIVKIMNLNMNSMKKLEMMQI